MRHRDRVIASLGGASFGNGVLREVVLRPGGPPVLSLHQIAPHAFGRVIAEPRLTVHADGIDLRLEADSPDGTLRHACTVALRLAGDGFTWEFDHDTRVVKACSFPESRLFPRTDPVPSMGGRGVWAFEFTDPMPRQAFAPKEGRIRADRPDIVFPQPWFRRGGWRKNWSHFLFRHRDQGLVRVPMNHLENHDKDLWPQADDGLLAFVGGRGTNLQYRFLDSTGRGVHHHYCMWGYDIHFWAVMAGSGLRAQPPRLKRGHRFHHRYILEPISDRESKHLLAASTEHPLTPAHQRRLDNTPAYDPGTNRFQRGLGRQDDGGFFQAALTADFLPTQPGRRSPGCILLDNHLMAADAAGRPLAPYNAWALGLGPDNWHEPIRPGRRYEISVWARLEPEDDATCARIAVQWAMQHAPGTTRFRVRRSRVLHSPPLHGRTPWTRLVVTTPPMPRTYVSLLDIRLELLGRGLGWFDEFRCRPLP